MITKDILSEHLSRQKHKILTQKDREIKEREKGKKKEKDRHDTSKLLPTGIFHENNENTYGELPSRLLLGAFI